MTLLLPLYIYIYTCLIFLKTNYFLLKGITSLLANGVYTAAFPLHDVGIRSHFIAIKMYVVVLLMIDNDLI